MAYLKTEYKEVEYHGKEWMELVEQGWVTMHETKPGWVRMIRQTDSASRRIVSGR